MQPERRIDHLKILLQSTVDQCLIQRGYSRFRLTDMQRRKLGKLRPSSAQRQSYLYSLASDAAILTAQAL